MLWRRYIRSEKVWKKIVEKAARKSPILVKQNGWSQHLTTMGGQDPDNVDVYRQVGETFFILAQDCCIDSLLVQ